jgi:hypothetical protein
MGPPTPSPASKCGSPKDPKGEKQHSLTSEGVGGDPIRTTGNWHSKYFVRHPTPAPHRTSSNPYQQIMYVQGGAFLLIFVAFLEDWPSKIENRKIPYEDDRCLLPHHCSIFSSRYLCTPLSAPGTQDMNRENTLLRAHD